MIWILNVDVYHLLLKNVLQELAILALYKRLVKHELQWNNLELKIKKGEINPGGSKLHWGTLHVDILDSSGWSEFTGGPLESATLYLFLETSRFVGITDYDLKGKFYI